MATTDMLVASTRKSVAKQIGSYLLSLRRSKQTAQKSDQKTLASSAGHPKTKLADDFAYCTVSLQNVLSPPSDTTSLLVPIGMWIHTVSSGKTMTHYALSREGSFAKSPHAITCVVNGPLAGKIDGVVNWLESREKGDGAIVRILAFPAFYAHAFGILRDGKAFAVLVDQPKGFSKLHFEKEYPLKEFLAKLSQESHT